MTYSLGVAPASTFASVSHVISEANVWVEAKRLDRILVLAGEDTSEVDLEGLAHQTLIRDLRKRLVEHGLTVIAMPWRANGLTGDLEVECQFASDTDAVFTKMALG